MQGAGVLANPLDHGKNFAFAVRVKLEPHGLHGFADLDELRTLRSVSLALFKLEQTGRDGGHLLQQHLDLDMQRVLDGILTLRWMLGMTGTNATKGALGGSPGRTDAADIAAHLNAQLIDIDGDSSVDAATDGVLLLRALLGLSGTAVTNGAVSPCATRTTWTEIRAHLAGICGLTLAP